MDDASAPIVFDRAAGYYDATRGFPPGVGERVAELLARAGGLAPRSHVLEVGVGTGRIALPLARLVARVTGVDLSRPMLEELRAKREGARVEVVRADAARLPFASAEPGTPKGFDAVVGVHVFHLVPRWRAVLREIARVLRRDGVLLHAADDASADGALRLSARALAEGFGQRAAGVPRERLETFPEDEGWTQVAPPLRIEFERRLAPREIVERLAARTWSATWKMSDEELARAVSDVRARLIERFGALDPPVSLPCAFWVRAYRPPAR